jgi:hypothetical protein
VSDEGSDAFSDDVACVLCESLDKAAPSMGEVCAEVCLAVLARPALIVFYYNKIFILD